MKILELTKELAETFQKKTYHIQIISAIFMGLALASLIIGMFIVSVISPEQGSGIQAVLHIVVYGSSFCCAGVSAFCCGYSGGDISIYKKCYM